MCDDDVTKMGTRGIVTDDGSLFNGDTLALPWLKLSVADVST